MGTASTMAMSVVSSVPTRKMRTPRWTWTGSHFVPVRKEKPKWANAGRAWMTIERDEGHEQHGEQGGHHAEHAPVGAVGHDQETPQILPRGCPVCGGSVARLVTSLRAW